MGHTSHYIKGCATCDNWGGSRKAGDPWGNRVEFDENAKGNCYAKVWSWDTKARSNDACAKC